MAPQIIDALYTTLEPLHLCQQERLAKCLKNDRGHSRETILVRRLAQVLYVTVHPSEDCDMQRLASMKLNLVEALPPVWTAVESTEE